MKFDNFKKCFGPISTFCKFRAFATSSSEFQIANRAQLKRKNDWQGVIGLEIHAQINSESKLFSGAATEFASPINKQVSFFDAALPGTLPVISRRCVEAGVLTSLALSCKINLTSKFDRKHYFYADLPAGYQITQQRQPLAKDGKLRYMIMNPNVSKTPFHKEARIIQVQLEQDSGKSLHDAEESRSLIDLNRAGVGLMEIVTAPDFHSGDEAGAFVKEVASILQVLGTCNAVMAEGNMRVDANISVNKQGEPLGIRSEVKNINSIRSVAKAIEFEIDRHIALLEEGKEIINETRTFDAETGETVAMRDKEKIQDYRFMPEPNLPPLHLYTDETLPTDLPHSQIINVDSFARSLPELPEGQRQRLQSQYGLSLEHSYILVSRDLVHFFDEVVKKKTRNLKLVLNLIFIDLLGLLNLEDTDISDCKVTAHNFGDLVDMLAADKINTDTAKKVLKLLFEGNGNSTEKIVQEHNWYQIKDKDEIHRMCLKIINEETKAVMKYKRGNQKFFQKLVGKVMIHSANRANGKMVVAALKELLDSDELKT